MAKRRRRRPGALVRAARHRRQDLQARGPPRHGVILAFYPGDFTPGLHQAVLLLPRRRRPASTTSGALLGHLAAVRRLARALGRGAGAERAAAGRRGHGGGQGYGVQGWVAPLAWLAERGGRSGRFFIKRSIFVVDGEGIVRYRHAPPAPASRQSEDLERAVAALA